MKKFTFILIGFLLLNACNSTKKVEKTISKGDYDHAIEISVKKLSKNKGSKKKQKYIVLLEDAYAKAVNRNLNDLKQFELNSNPAIIEQIYETYVTLDNRQELIKPILPLHILNENRDANFVLMDYSYKLSSAKKSLSDYLYANAKKLLQNNSIEDAREAYNNLEYLNKISPNFKDVNQLLEEAHFKGTNFVFVALKNQTNQVIPIRLEDDLLNFNAYGLDKFWTVFHSEKENNIDYNYQLSLLFKQIDVSPERFVEKQTKLEREIKDGFEYALDANGHVKKDSLGNAIKVDKYITVKSNFYEIHQEKACHINTEIEITDKHNKLIESFPLESEFVFINDFAEMDGDIRALDSFQKELIKKQEIPFPSDEQIIFDTGEDLKTKLKDYIDDLEL